jgi:hypothetical protein
VRSESGSEHDEIYMRNGGMSEELEENICYNIGEYSKK